MRLAQSYTDNSFHPFSSFCLGVFLPQASRALFAADLHITSTSVADDRIAETVKAVYAHSDYLLDPHSAVGVAAVRAGAAPASTDSNHTVCLACAHPAKFPATVASILGRNDDDAAALPIPNQDHPCVKHVVSLYTTAVRGGLHLWVGCGAWAWAAD